MNRADPFALDDEIASPTEEAAPQPPKASGPPTPAPIAFPPKEPSPAEPIRIQEKTEVKPKTARKRGRPVSNNPKLQITLRLDKDVVQYFRAQGKGWQTRINTALRAAAGLEKSRKAPSKG